VAVARRLAALSVMRSRSMYGNQDGGGVRISAPRPARLRLKKGERASDQN
jgi:hypothetical protein